MTGLNWIVVSLSVVVSALFIFLIKWIFSLRRVVNTDEAHVVRKGKATLQYGGKDSAGNAYYAWPQWVPVVGTSVTKLSLKNFEFKVKGFEACDQEKLPFVVDLTAFFQITNCMVAAERASSMDVLTSQLRNVVEGVARRVLAQDDLETIMVERSKYGKAFTQEIQEDLAAWGVEAIKVIELTDIRDIGGEEVIDNISAKRKSWIARDSRVTVAKNLQEAEEAEIAAKQEIALKQKASDEVVGLREAEVQKKVGIATQQSEQAVKEEAKITMEKDMDVRKVETVRTAEIARDAKIVEAEADRKKTEIDAEAAKKKTELEAEAALVRATKNAEGIEAEGRAKANAEEKMQLASVTAQTSLAKEIGENDGYQKYLIEIRKVEATEKVGLEQAKNINGSNIKIIANAGNVSDGLNSALDVLTPKGGANIAGAIEAFAATEAGRSLLEKLGINVG